MGGGFLAALFGTFVASETMRSWYNAAKALPVSYYRDKEWNEIDLIHEPDGKLHPIGIKKSANPEPDARVMKDALTSFGVLMNAI